MKLTEVDRKVLASYGDLMDGLAAYLGSGCEIVLHSLENLDKSVIKIVNGEHTGRNAGAPITNLAFEMLKKLQADKGDTHITYFTRNSKGEPLKSATIAIMGERKRIIGLLCLNYYLNTPLQTVLSAFGANENATPAGRQEIFSKTQSELLDEAILQAQSAVYMDATVLPSLKNKRIVEQLHKQGFFKMKNSVAEVAQKLGISKNTVYLHIRNIESGR